MARKPRKVTHYGTAKVISGTSAPTSNLEQNPRADSQATHATAAFDTPVCITVVSYRTRLADADGISAKAAIDGLVHAGIIADDGPAHVHEVRYRQVKVGTKREEKTILEIETVTVD